MDHRRLKWLQTELSRVFSRITGEEVEFSAEEALYIVSVLNQGSPVMSPISTSTLSPPVLQLN